VHSRRDPQEVVTALSADDGSVEWRREYPAAFAKNQYANAMAKGPNATPLVADGRLFTFGVSGIFVAWEAASGRELWRKDFSALVDSTRLFCGTAASPVLAHGLVVVQVGSDVHGGRILGLDPATGETRWTWKGPGPGYASPFVVDVRGSSQLITMTNESIIGLDARTGVALWSAPFADEWHENIVTPVWTGSRLIASGTRQGTRAFSLDRTDSGWKVTEAWQNTEVAMYMSTPVLADGALIGLSARRKGQFVALDVETGALRWASEGRDADHASVLLTSAHIVYLTSTGDLLLVKRNGSEFATDRRYGDLASRPTYAVPVVLGDDLLIRDTTHVTRLGGR
jgi:outer membrane protein assembly factor BamB